MIEDLFEKAERLVLEASRDPSKSDEYQAATEAARRLEGVRNWKGKRTMTQAEKILAHIEKTGSITQREAFLDYSIQSFHRRLSDLKEAGHELIGVSKTHPVTGQEYTRYFLDADLAAREHVEAT